MATQEEAEVTESTSSSGPSITVGLAVSSSKSSKYVVKWALEKCVVGDRTRFMLIHVRQKVTLIPTPLGNYMPVDQVKEEIVTAYEKEVECQAQNMLLMYKNMCDKKVEAEVLVVKGDNVADTLSGVVSACHIRKLVVGVSSQRKLVGKFKEARASSRILKSVPNFCKVYAVSKGGLSVVYPPIPEDGDSSEIFQFNSSSDSGLDSDDKSSVSGKVL